MSDTVLRTLTDAKGRLDGWIKPRPVPRRRPLIFKLTEWHPKRKKHRKRSK